MAAVANARVVARPPERPHVAPSGTRHHSICGGAADVVDVHGRIISKPIDSYALAIRCHLSTNDGSDRVDEARGSRRR